MTEDNEQTKLQRANIRRRYVVDLIKAGDSVRAVEIADKFHCSLHTVRNDLQYLRSLGIEVHTKRGVVLANTLHRASIIREIKFPAKYKDAGVSILAYFSRVLEEKYPETDATVVISQHGDSVTLKIESDEGELERIEETLFDYGKVVKGEIAPREFLPDIRASLELTNKLEMAKMELRLKEQSFNAIASIQGERIASLEGQVSELRCLIGTQLGAVQSLSSSISEISNSNRITKSVAKAIETITKLVDREHSYQNEMALRNALLAVRNEDKTLFETIKNSVASFTNSVAANLATPWVVAVLNSLPK